MSSEFSFESNIFTTSDGEKVHYVTCSTNDNVKSDNPWLIFLHGQGGAASAWQVSQIIAASEGYNSIAIDLRGHGESSHPASGNAFKIQNFANDIVAIIESLGIEKVILVGHCFGGMVSMQIAAQNHPSIEKMILISSCYQSSLFGRISPVPKIFTIAMRKAASLVPKGTPKMIGDYSRFKNTFDIDFRRLYADIRSTTLKSFLLGYAEVFAFNAVDLVEKITVSTLVIGGENDIIHPVKVTKQLGAKIANSRTIFLKDANHILVLSKPNEVMKLVLDFVKNADVMGSISEREETLA